MGQESAVLQALGICVGAERTNLSAAMERQRDGGWVQQLVSPFCVHACQPTACLPLAAHPETNGHDGVKMVVLHLAGDLSDALVLNYSITSNSCRRLKLPLGENGLQMVVHRAHTDLKKVGHQLYLSKNTKR